MRINLTFLRTLVEELELSICNVSREMSKPWSELKNKLFNAAFGNGTKEHETGRCLGRQDASSLRARMQERECGSEGRCLLPLNAQQPRRSFVST